MNIDQDYWNSVKRPEVINKEYANRKYSYLQESMNNNWRIIPNSNDTEIPLYSNYTYNNHILPNKKIPNFKWIKNTPLWKKKPSFDLKPFQRYQKEMNLNEDNYLDTNINSQGDVESFKDMYKEFLKNNNNKNKLLIKGVMEDTEILTKPFDKYNQHYDNYGFESYN
jgi:hypothetical protein